MAYQMIPYETQEEKALELERQKNYRITDLGYSTPCWIWLGQTVKGYGRIKFMGLTFAAHAMFYRQMHKGFNYKLELDHKCKNKACVNPDHMEPITHAENLLRSDYMIKLKARQMSLKRKLEEDLKSGLTPEESMKKYGLYKSKYKKILQEN
jgi:hypothetical protein